MMKSKKTSRIVAESSLSVQINGGWYKFSALEEQELSGYTEDEADEALKELFDRVNAQVDSQVEDALKANGVDTH